MNATSRNHAVIKRERMWDIFNARNRGVEIGTLAVRFGIAKRTVQLIFGTAVRISTGEHGAQKRKLAREKKAKTL